MRLDVGVRLVGLLAGREALEQKITKISAALFAEGPLDGAGCALDPQLYFLRIGNPGDQVRRDSIISRQVAPSRLRARQRGRGTESGTGAIDEENQVFTWGQREVLGRNFGVEIVIEDGTIKG